MILKTIAASEPLTERRIQRLLWRSRYNAFRVLLPNYTPRGWFECDVFGVTKAGYFNEFEIKLTAADLARDHEKERGASWRYVDGQRQDIPGHRKHDLLSASDHRGPCRYWLVVPRSLESQAIHLPYAGVLVADAGQFNSDRFELHEIRSAPRLHEEKIDPKIPEHAIGVCYWRYWHEIERGKA